MKQHRESQMKIPGIFQEKIRIQLLQKSERFLLHMRDALSSRAVISGK